ncbi:hypothetical protein COCNU_03G012160 [Cocos nucifera]|uniref:Uncharacterized protein n=1 Tax=Cocos nucifera TaxID=13894 RepID=A0A8K0MYQ8_COCNU|nr:hypothetical protein COCNU_03G012160 [Cocos nucifera]
MMPISSAAASRRDPWPSFVTPLYASTLLLAATATALARFLHHKLSKDLPTDGRIFTSTHRPLPTSPPFAQPPPLRYPSASLLIQPLSPTPLLLCIPKCGDHSWLYFPTVRQYAPPESHPRLNHGHHCLCPGGCWKSNRIQWQWIEARRSCTSLVPLVCTSPAPAIYAFLQEIHLPSPSSSFVFLFSHGF